MKVTQKWLLGIVVFFQLILFTQNQDFDDSEEVFDDLREFYTNKKYRAEFIEDVTKASYLDQISYDDRFLLDLYLLDVNLKSKSFKLDLEYLNTCPRAIYKSIGMSGFTNPLLRTNNIIICPNMRSNCCTNNDINILGEIWDDYSTFVRLNYDYFTYYVKYTLNNIELFIEKAKELDKTSPGQICSEIANSIIKYEFDDFSEDMFIQQMYKVKDYNLSLKKGFRCLLCDHQNTRFIDPLMKMVYYNKDFCVGLVKNTFGFYTNLNDIFIRYFNSIGMLAKCYANNGNETQAIFDFIPDGEDEEIDFLNQSTSLYHYECREAVEKNDENKIFTNCLNYCHQFDLWNFEGMLPDVVKMGKIFELISRNLMEEPEIQVLQPKEKMRTYKFPFKDDSWDVFRKFEFMFTEDGIREENLMERE